MKACDMCEKSEHCPLLKTGKTDHCIYVRFFESGARLQHAKDSDIFVDWFKSEHDYADDEWLKEKVDELNKYLEGKQ